MSLVYSTFIRVSVYWKNPQARKMWQKIIPEKADILLIPVSSIYRYMLNYSGHKCPKTFQWTGNF